MTTNKVSDDKLHPEWSEWLAAARRRDPEQDVRLLNYRDFTALLEAALSAQSAERPTAWIATSPSGRVLYLVEADGWKVEPVQSAPPGSAAPSNDDAPINDARRGSAEQSCMPGGAGDRSQPAGVAPSSEGTGKPAAWVSQSGLDMLKDPRGNPQATVAHASYGPYTIPLYAVSATAPRTDDLKEAVELLREARTPVAWQQANLTSHGRAERKKLISRIDSFLHRQGVGVPVDSTTTKEKP